MSPIEQLCSKIQSVLRRAVERNLGDGLFLSVGLDTSAVASIAARGASPRAFTVAFQEADAPVCSEWMAFLNSSWHKIEL